MTTTKQTLEQWAKSCPTQLITVHSPAIGVHDTVGIRQIRTWLWDLSDYVVSSVTGGVIWLVPRKTA